MGPLMGPLCSFQKLGVIDENTALRTLSHSPPLTKEQSTLL